MYGEDACASNVIYIIYKHILRATFWECGEDSTSRPLRYSH
jgi:hypothetical protein